MYDITCQEERTVLSIIQDILPEYPDDIDFSYDPYYDEFGLYKSPFSILYCICNRGLPVAPLLNRLFTISEDGLNFLVDIHIIKKIINFTDIDGNNCLHVLILMNPMNISNIQHIMQSGLFDDNRNSSTDTALDSALLLYHYLYKSRLDPIQLCTESLTMYSRLIYVLSEYETLSVSFRLADEIKDSLPILLDSRPCSKYIDTP